MENGRSADVGPSLQQSGLFDLEGEMESVDSEHSNKSPKENSRQDSNKVTAKTIMRLIELQRFRCALTGVKLTPSTASLDHIVPLSRGGLHSIGNVHVVLNDVNRMKYNFTVEEFVTYCRMVVDHANGSF